MRDAPVLAEDTAPMIDSDGKTLTLTFTDMGMLDEDSVPAADAFDVMVSSGGAGPSIIYDVMSVNVEGMTVVLTLEGAIAATDGITVSYTKPDSNALADTSGKRGRQFQQCGRDGRSDGGADGRGADGGGAVHEYGRRRRLRLGFRGKRRNRFRSASARDASVRFQHRQKEEKRRLTYEFSEGERRVLFFRRHEG